MIRTAAITAAIAWTAYGLVQAVFPYSWGHRLSEDCSWAPRGAFGLLGRASAETRAAAHACKGLMSPTPDVKVFLARFPTPAERATWSDQ